MKIYIMVKAVGKRRPILDRVPYDISDNVSTLRELLTELVRIEVENYNRKEKEAQLIPFLTAEEVENQAQVGKVSFGTIFSDKKADLQKAIENALQCQTDGLVRVFHNEEEIEKLDDTVQIREEDCVTLIRLTFLSGRLW